MEALGHKYSDRNQEDAALGYVILARVIIAITAIMFIFNVFFTLSIMQLIPMIKVEPILVDIENDSEDIAVFEPFYLKSMFEGRDDAPVREMVFKDEIIKTFIKRYVVLRNTILLNSEVMQRRWGPRSNFAELSTGKIYNNFNEFKKSDKAFNDLMRSNTVRSVEISKIERAQPNQDIHWVVDFKTYDVLKKERKEQFWKATIQINMRESRIKFDKSQREKVSINNPFGFVIINYSQEVKNFGLGS